MMPSICTPEDLTPTHIGFRLSAHARTGTLVVKGEEYAICDEDIIGTLTGVFSEAGDTYVSLSDGHRSRGVFALSDSAPVVLR